MREVDRKEGPAKRSPRANTISRTSPLTMAMTAMTVSMISFMAVILRSFDSCQQWQE